MAWKRFSRGLVILNSPSILEVWFNFEKALPTRNV